MSPPKFDQEREGTQKVLTTLSTLSSDFFICTFEQVYYCWQKTARKSLFLRKGLRYFGKPEKPGKRREKNKEIEATLF